MAEFGTVGLMSGAIALNGVKAVKSGRDPYPLILSGAIVMVVFVVLGGIRPKLGLAAAAVFFLATVLDTAPIIVDIATKATTSKKIIIHTPATPGSSGKSGFSSGNGGAALGAGGSSSGSW